MSKIDKLLDGVAVERKIMEPQMNSDKPELKSSRACQYLSAAKKVLELKS